MLERARSEVAALASRRQDITTQLGHLSGVIDALAVPDKVAAADPPPSGDGPPGHPASASASTDSTSTDTPTSPDPDPSHQERTDHE